MTDKTREKTLEEQIAEGLYTRMNPASKFLSWDELDVGGKAREVWVTEAKEILAIRQIKEGQKLLEKADKLVELISASQDPAPGKMRLVKPLASGEW